MGTKKAKFKAQILDDDLVWRSGVPKVPGWYNASRSKNPNSWRWCDGKQWSDVFTEFSDTSRFDSIAHNKAYYSKDNPILYRTYWPKNARVPRPKGR